ncbi:hypothetical protein BC941DRAFT_408244 [Chlamydoabsidia padenii]|nr:hypothetical protein BC941DRAFT_408244 [Chlamydoabsidia padenii]
MTDLIFSEASFLRPGSLTSTMSPINESDEIKINNDATNNHSSPIKPPAASSNKDLSITLSDSHSSKSIHGFFDQPHQHLSKSGTPINSISPTTNCHSPDQIAKGPSTRMATIIEPTYVYPHQAQQQALYPVMADSSPGKQQPHPVPDRQLSYYSHGISPIRPTETHFLTNDGQDSETWDSYTYSYYRGSSSSTVSLHAWDSASMVGTYRPPDPPVFVFTNLKGPTPFRPRLPNTASLGSFSSKQVSPRLPSSKPIYPVYQPQQQQFFDSPSEDTYDSGEDSSLYSHQPHHQYHYQPFYQQDHHTANVEEQEWNDDSTQDPLPTFNIDPF